MNTPIDFNSIRFNHTTEVQLRFNDADALGHINNSVYFSFYDLGKSAYFKAINGRVIHQHEIDIVVVHAEVDFLAPVFLTDEIVVQTAVCAIGQKSFTLVQRIVDVTTGAVKCVCSTVMAGYDATTKRSKEISDVWREAISRFEGHSF
ncbi:MAG: acyl-CoA thioesterase [Prevotellaceae bacterium]|jgi:acyl-CoA thioester hydrolase|nr:acyl-CoA thioesterase [Prevotellaceae bacterium]